MEGRKFGFLTFFFLDGGVLTKLSKKMKEF